MYQFMVFAVLSFIVPFLFSGQVGSETRSDGAFIAVSTSFVRQKILDAEYISSLQDQGLAGSLDVIHLNYEGTPMSAFESQPGDILTVTDRFATSRAAKVVLNTPRSFVYREDMQWGQRIVHNITFAPADPAAWREIYRAPSMVLTHERTWQGNSVLQFLRWAWEGADAWIGERLPAGTMRGLEDFRVTMQDAWEKRREVGSSP